MGGRLMLALRGDAALGDDDAKRLRSPAVGGVILFARNFVDSAQLRRLTADIRRAAGEREILIAVDQEGGRVQRFANDGFTVAPAPAALAAQGERAGELAEAAGLVLAAELLAHGVDLTFAPSLDIGSGRSAIIGERAFSADADVVAELGARFAAGLERGGMPACGKHFPGHGHAVADSHAALPVDERTREEMAACDWIPFARFAKAGGALLMTAHIVYPAVDGESAATYSATWLREILRERLGFRGLVVCDDLCMAGADIGDLPARMRAARAAGCDLWLVCRAEEADKAVAFAENEDGAGGNVWRELSRARAPRVCVGDLAYRRARDAIAPIAGGG